MKTDHFGPSAQEIFQLQKTILQQVAHVPDQQEKQEILDYLAWSVAALVDDLVDEPRPIKQPLANVSLSTSTPIQVGESKLSPERLARRKIHLAELETRTQRASLPLEERLPLYVEDLVQMLRTLLRLTLERQQPGEQAKNKGAKNA